MAAKQLLDCVNQILVRVNIISGNANYLTSLTDSTRQHNIDVAVQVINEGIDEVYSLSQVQLPIQIKESSITLTTGTREYSLASDLITLTYPFDDRVNTQYIFEFKGSYNDFLLIDPQQNYTGLPILGMISPITNMFRVDRACDAPSNGRTYFYEYKRDMVLVNATDSVPFNNEVFRAMVPAWAQLYKREMQNEFDQQLYQQAIGRASRAITETLARISYSPKV